MITRILDAKPSQMLQMSKSELLESIKLSEGRVIASEVIGKKPLFQQVSNSELATAFGADIILLNMFDVHNPFFANITENISGSVVHKIKKLCGCLVGLNLEPVDDNMSELRSIPVGRRASLETVAKAIELGFDFICLTGNPATGVSNQAILETIRKLPNEVKEKIIIMAGKMHMSGVIDDNLDQLMLEHLIKVGADVILLPMPGTVPGITIEDQKRLTRQIHQAGALVMNTLGTSQESADPETIKHIAISSKMAGADLHHIGDAGYSGIAILENIMTMSIAIRGKRHTYKRMAISVNR